MSRIHEALKKAKQERDTVQGAVYLHPPMSRRFHQTSPPTFPI